MGAGRGAALGAGLTALILVASTWPLLLHLDGAHIPSAFGDSHIWVLETLRGALARGELPAFTCGAGFPAARSMQAIGWAPLLVYAPLRLLLTPLAAGNLVHLLSLPLSAAAGALLIGKATGCGEGKAGLLGAAWALCPPLLGALATLELSNTQAWTLPLFLLALGAAGRGGLAMLLPALVGALTAFTSPYYGLAMPLLAGGWAAWGLVARRPAAPLLGTLLLLALALLPARAYYDPDAVFAIEGVFSPAQRATVIAGDLPYPPPVATLDGLLWPQVRAPGSPYETQHLGFVGPALALGGLLGLARGQGPGRRLGLGLVLGGLALCLGPCIAAGGRYLSLGGGLIPGPAYLLERVGYPTALGGLYFRYTVLLALGLMLGLARLPGWGISSACAGLLVLQGLRAAGMSWPLPVETVDLAAFAADPPGEGAILELPLPGPVDGQWGQAGLLRAVILNRPTSALPRAVRGQHPLAPLAAAALAQGSAPLTAAGFRYVVLPDELVGHGSPSLAALEAALGPGERAGGLIRWDLGPAALPACQARPR